MRKDREKAVALRQQGKSYAEITKKLGIPKATLSGWFRDQPWSVVVRDSLGAPSRLGTVKKIKKMAEVNRQRWAEWRQSAQDKATKEFSVLQKDLRFFAAIMLYWSQGDINLKTPVVRFASNDSDMIKLMFSFFSKTLALPLDKISCRLLLYPNLPDSPQRSFWSKATSIPLSRFKRSSVVANRSRNNQKSFGVCNIYIYSRELKEKMLRWLELTKNDLL